MGVRGIAQCQIRVRLFLAPSAIVRQLRTITIGSSRLSLPHHDTQQNLDSVANDQEGRGRGR